MGVVAQTRAEPLAFDAGWTRLVLAPCPRAGALASRLEVDGADRRLAFAAGRAGGATLGVLTGSEQAYSGAPQTFDLPTGSARARDVVLAPWPPPSPPPRVRRLRLLGPTPDR